MKKITLFSLLVLSAFGLNAQNNYNLTVSQQTYADLQNATSVNNNQVWDLDDFGPINIPFNFSVAGQSVNRFMFDDDDFLLMTPNGDYDTGEGLIYLYSTNAYIQDRSYSTGTSTSPIGYKVDGAMGNRILKLEVKNAGLEEGPTSYYLSYQMWLYEIDNSIEIRYGQNNITDLSLINGDGTALAAIDPGMDYAYFISGDSAAPTYAEYNEDTFPDNLSLNAIPANGTVYRLTPAGVAGVKNIAYPTIRLYPNPASSILNLKADGLTSANYAIYDVMGKLIIENKIDNDNAQINVESLNSGIYFIKVNNQFLKFIKQ